MAIPESKKMAASESRRCTLSSSVAAEVTIFLYFRPELTQTHFKGLGSLLAQQHI